jgi:hypothetical protein
MTEVLTQLYVELIDGCFSVIAGCQKCRYKGSFVTCHQNLAV